ncbi:MAG TPA: hypothetical protein VLA71_11030 [Algoriphagus sp.]|nr:hypothetical protein [Algoriphagus sp.]
MKNTSLVMLLFVTAVWLTSCYKDSPPDDSPYQPIDYTVLPPITQTGANTFGCLVDGEVWVPRVPLFSWTLDDKAFSLDESKGLGYGHGTFRLVDSSYNDWMTLSFGFTFFEPGIFFTSPDDPDSSLLKVLFKRGISDNYQPDYSVPLLTNNWKVTKVDTIKNFISGTFEFTLYNTLNKNDSIVVTDGRFDILYYPQ